MDNKSKDDLTFEQIEIGYRTNNIIREKIELYYDFISSLLNLIDQTYLGPDFIQSDEDIFSHFNWCFNKIISNFEKERIYFIPKGSHHSYLWSFFYKGYYTYDNPDKFKIVSDYFKIIFDYRSFKTPIEFETLVDLYKILDLNLKKLN